MFVLKLSGIQIDISTNKFHMPLEECTIKNYRMLNARNVNESVKMYGMWKFLISFMKTICMFNVYGPLPF